MPSAELAASLRCFFGLGTAFPWHRLAARSPQARSLVLLGEQPLCLLRRDAAAGRLRVVSSGVRLFDAEVIKGVGCAYRLCHEGLQHVLARAGAQPVQGLRRQWHLRAQAAALLLQGVRRRWHLRARADALEVQGLRRAGAG